MTTKETKLIIGKKAATMFAKLYCTGENLERALAKIEKSWHRFNRQQVSVLEVPGFAEIDELFEFSFYDMSTERSWGRDEPDYWALGDGSEYVLRIIPTGEILRFWCPDNSGKRFALELRDRQMGPCRDFKFDEERPQYIGKATEKKIQAWIDYQHRKREAEANYMAEARVKNAQLRAAILKRFPYATLRENDGWLVEAWFSEGVLDYVITATESGGFSRTYSVNFGRVPSYKDQLGIE
ncbi:MAG: hypothetical protein IKH15_09390 [Bacteroidales bacterium]|nr:hypothetical protein [Bacteroidales bacterium]